MNQTINIIWAAVSLKPTTYSETINNILLRIKKMHNLHFFWEFWNKCWESDIRFNSSGLHAWKFERLCSIHPHHTSYHVINNDLIKIRGVNVKLSESLSTQTSVGHEHSFSPAFIRQTSVMSFIYIERGVFA